MACSLGTMFSGKILASIFQDFTADSPHNSLQLVKQKKLKIDKLASLMYVPFVPTLCMVQDHDLYLFGC